MKCITAEMLTDLIKSSPRLETLPFYALPSYMLIHAGRSLQRS